MTVNITKDSHKRPGLDIRLRMNLAKIKPQPVVSFTHLKAVLRYLLGNMIIVCEYVIKGTLNCLLCL